MSQSPVSHTEILKTIQQHGRDVQADRDNLVEELLVLAQCLHINSVPEGVNFGVLGGLQYLIRRLHEQFECQQSLDQLAEKYAQVELYSFASSPEQVDEVRDWARREGLIVRVIPVQCPDGTTRQIFASHLDQTSVNGKVYQAGELIHSPKRFPPPFVWLLNGTPYERTSG
jgi:hypothetical protein